MPLGEAQGREVVTSDTGILASGRHGSRWDIKALKDSTLETPQGLGPGLEDLVSYLPLPSRVTQLLESA